MASLSKASNVILSSGLATQGIHNALAETNVGYYRWFDGDEDTLVGLFGMFQRERAAIDESHMARLFVLSLKKAWFEDCAGAPENRCFDNEAVKDFVVDGCFDRVWDSVCRVSHLVTDDEMENFLDAATSILANANGERDEAVGFWERVLEEQVTPDVDPSDPHPQYLNARQCALSSAWLRRPDVFRTLAQKHLRKNDHQDPYHTMHEAWEFFLLYERPEQSSGAETEESSPVTKVEPERIENMSTENKPSDGINELQSGLSAVLGMHATAWKDAAVHRGGEVVNTAITETALKAAPTTVRLWIGADKPSNWKRHAFKLLASSMAAGVARWTGNSRFQRLANAALVAAWTDAMRMLPIEEWIRTFLNSADIGKAEALLNGEIPPANNDAKLEALAEQVAALTKALAQQAEKTSK